jgi:Raf kinase inhibitor-like YbhB/YbcL family protein
MQPNPYLMLKDHPRFELKSDDMQDGQRLRQAQLGSNLGGQDMFPQLGWSVYDPDAPTPSGFWHWAAYNIPKTTTELARGAGNNLDSLPAGTMVINNDRGIKEFIGAAPPAGTGRHRYFFVIYALNVAKLDISANATPAVLTFSLRAHTLAWASLVTWYEQV